MSDPSNNLINSINESDFETIKDYCLTNLKILSKIAQGDKLSIYNENFYIDQWYYTQPIVRWYYCESREKTITYLEAFISKVFECIDYIYTNYNKSNINLNNTFYTKLAKSKVPAFKEEGANLLITFINEIKNAIDGLNNLKQTYINDITTVSAIEVIVEKLNIRVKKVSDILAIERPKLDKN